MVPMMALRLIGLAVVCCSSSGFPTPLPFQVSMEGSADGEEPSNLVPSPSTPATGGLSSENQTTPGGRPHVETLFLNQVVNFLQENLLLILVGAALLLLIFAIICGAVFMSRRRKVNAYYPSSFPSKMYVDQRDKTGGTKLFNEVPEKPSRRQESEPMDSRKQLQADIMRAAKSLRTPNKSPEGEGKDPGQKIEAQSPKDSPGILNEELSDLLEQKELRQLSDKEAAAGSSSPELPPVAPESTCLDDESEPPSGRGVSQAQQDHRPSAQHSSDSLQLITGEKTAF